MVECRINARNSTQRSIYFNITKKISTSAASYPRIIETKGSVPIHLFTDDIEKQALDQLKTLAESNIATDFIAVMPDVHLRKGVTIGCVFASEKYICPNAVGVDIGCGLAAVPIEGLVKSDMRREQLTEIQKLIKERIPTGFNQHRHSVKDSKEILKLISSEIQPTPFLKKQLSLPRVTNQLGTLGGGNHFLEVVYDSKTEEVWILLHSGSRNIGNRVAQHYDKVAKGYLVEQGIDVKKLKGIHYMPIDSKEGQNYLRDMEWCQKYAFHNRRIMKEIMVNIMFEVTGKKANEKKAINIHHNYCSCEICGNRRLYITRKGATSAKLNEMGIIPGSMGTGSYITRGKGNPMSWNSSSHGAGRRMSRTQAHKKISQTEFEDSMRGVVCDTHPSVKDEAPMAYKNLSEVMKNQESLSDIVCHLSPITYCQRKRI